MKKRSGLLHRPKVPTNSRITRYLKFSIVALIGFILSLGCLNAIANNSKHNKNNPIFYSVYIGAGLGVLQNLSSIERSSNTITLGVLRQQINPDPSSYEANFMANLFFWLWAVMETTISCR